jgi:PAS domain S-box-containing protein
MRLFDNLPIKHKLTLLSLLASALALLLASAGFVIYEQFAFRRDTVAELAATAEMFAFNSASALMFNDPDSAEQTLESLKARGHIVAACIFDREGKLFASYPENSPSPRQTAPALGQSGENFGRDYLELFRPIAAGGDTVGTIYLRSDLLEMQERLVRYALIVGAVMLVAILAAWLIALWLQRVISEPVSNLAAMAGRVTAERDYSVRVQKRGDDEVGRLIDGFNDMLAQIQSRDTALLAANNTLERRVHERTAELWRENAERKRAEEALQASESFLKSLVENLPVFIFRKDREGRLTFANRRFGERFDRPVAELLGKNASELLPAVEAEKQARTDAQVMSSGRPYDAIEEVVRVGNRTGYIHLIKVPLFDRSGNCTGVQGMFIDVTERVQAEAKLAEASGLLDAMLRNSPDFIYFKDRDSRFVRFSDACLERLKVPDPEALLGKTDADFFTAEHAQSAFADEQEIIRTGRPIIGKLEKETHPDGHVTWVLTTKMPWRDGTGAIVGIFGISKDVTALKETEQRLAYERDQLRALLDSSPDTIYFKDLESRFLRVSRSKVRRSIERVPDLRERRAARGLPADVPDDELLNGLTDFDTFSEDDAQSALEDEQQIIRTGEAITGKLEKRMFHDGIVRWHLTSKMPWRDAHGNIVGTFGISKDVSELKEAEQKLEQMHRQLVEASRQAGMAEVATGVLHNVGNVLNSVNVSATIVVDRVRQTKAANVAKLAALFAEHKSDVATFLTHDPRGQMIPGYLTTLAEMLGEEQNSITTELEHLRKNVEHIKDIVAMQQAYARTSGVMENVNVADLVEDALRINAGALTRHEIQTVREYRARPVVTTDKHKVMQILINLVRNAKYACDEGGRADKRITVQTTLEDHRVKISVIDNGVGIAAENLTRIFGHGFTTRKNGHGFGLHSGALAAKELGGALTVHSDGAGRGATFTIALPCTLEASPHEQPER